MAAKSGDDRAFEALYRRFRSALHRWTSSYALPRAERDDLMQHALIGFWEAVRGYDGRVPFAVFAKLCVLREVQMVLRMANRRKHQMHLTALSLDAKCPWLEETKRTILDVYIDRTAVGVEEWALDDGPRDDASAAELVAWAEQRWDVRLSPLERDVLCLRLEGYSYAEVAARLGCRKKSVDNAMQRIRKRVRKARQQGAMSPVHPAKVVGDKHGILVGRTQCDGDCRDRHTISQFRMPVERNSDCGVAARS